ncbi:MAG TPA: hypothetical protein DG757_05600, partial [Bacillus sp. (in: Bacteria)]|nr:hypothetical protein [Bacillus sp. (in: firmicutes)]
FCFFVHVLSSPYFMILGSTASDYSSSASYTNLVATFLMLILDYKLPLNKTLKKDKLIPKIFSYL